MSEESQAVQFPVGGYKLQHTYGGYEDEEVVFPVLNCVHFLGLFLAVTLLPYAGVHQPRYLELLPRIASW